MKNLLILAPLLLLFSNNYAQTPDLFVKPSASTDSYIYANDVVLYVENGIEIRVNTFNPQTRASIYLRGDSQLIQGEKPNSLNAGNGHLSVWQRGYANAFDYNYWASPVGNPFGPATGNTNFGIPRIFDAQNDGGAPHKTHSLQQQATSNLNGMPSDVTSGYSGSLRVSNRWIYTMRAGSQYSEWFYIGGQNGIGNGLAAGEGFTMKGTGTAANGAQFANAHNQLYDFRGRPNDGNITIDVGHNGTSGLLTLTGNPYPSALDLTAFFMDPDNDDIEAAAYYWDEDRTRNTHNLSEISGGYGTWIPLGGVYIDPLNHSLGTSGVYDPPTYIMYDGAGNPLAGSQGEGASFERRFAPIGQGFMVRGTASAPSGTATFKNSMRRYVPQGESNFSEFRNLTNNNSNTRNSSEEYKNYALPTLRFAIEIHDTYVRQMTLMFSPNSTTGVDRGFDGRNSTNISTGDTFWKLEDSSFPFIIQTRPYDYYDLIPISLRVKNGVNSFKINVIESYGIENLAEENGHPAGMYLYDQLNNQYQRLDLNNSALINYSGSAGIIEDRFFIVFRRGIQEVASLKNNIVNVSVFQNNPLSKLQLTNPDELDIKNASVYDMRGRLVISQNNIGKVNRYEFSTQGLSSGVYLVMLTTTDDQLLDYKVTIHNKN